MQPAIAVKQVTLDSLDKDVELGFVPEQVTITAETSISSATGYVCANPDGNALKITQGASNAAMGLVSSASSAVVSKSDTFYGVTIKSGIGFATGSSATVQVRGYRSNN